MAAPDKRKVSYLLKKHSLGSFGDPVDLMSKEV